MNRLTKKEKGFAHDYLETGNGTQAALNNYDTDDTNTAAVIASRTLRKAKVIEYLESKAQVVAEVVYKLATESENESIKLNASKDIMDRAGLKPIEKSQTVSVSVEVTSDDPQIEALRDQFNNTIKQKIIDDIKNNHD